MFIHYFVK